MWKRNRGWKHVLCGSEQQGAKDTYGTDQQTVGYSYGTNQQQYANYAGTVVINRVTRKEKYTFGEAVKSFFDNYANFSGRATVSEYWWAFLFNFALNFVLGGIPVIGVIVMLGTFIPGLSLSIRRLHDTGKSGWYLLMGMIPLAGAIILIVQYCKESVGDNQWGQGPSSW